VVKRWRASVLGQVGEMGGPYEAPGSRVSGGRRSHAHSCSSTRTRRDAGGPAPQSLEGGRDGGRANACREREKVDGGGAWEDSQASQNHVAELADDRVVLVQLQRALCGDWSASSAAGMAR
jgi:hypothetical protein